MRGAKAVQSIGLIGFWGGPDGPDSSGSGHLGGTRITRPPYAAVKEDDVEIFISPIKEEYVEGFYRCLDEVARERKYLTFTEAPPLESVREFVLSNIAEGRVQCVATVDGRVIGWCDILPRPWPGFEHVGGLGMGLLPRWRGRGIGKRLMEAALAWAKQSGFERIELEVYASNAPAIALYRRFGFTTEGVKVRGRKLDGVYDDIVQMALFL